MIGMGQFQSKKLLIEWDFLVREKDKLLELCRIGNDWEKE